jgi:hypothetical protein
VPLETVALFGFDGAVEIRVCLPQPDDDLSAREVVEDSHRLHDPLDTCAAPAAQQAGRVTGLPNRRAESVQHGHEHLGIGATAHASVVQVLEHHTAVGGERP